MSEVEYVKSWAEMYLSLGYNPLPSRAIDGRIRPSMKAFRDIRDDGIGTGILGEWWGECIQVCLGVPWGLAVVDLDNPLAVEVWKSMTMFRPPIRTWQVRHDPRGGMHVYFRPPLFVEAIPFNTCLWELEGEKHVKIELLGDRNLIVAPPSVSPKTGNRYSFLPGHGPEDIARPAEMPDWLIGLAMEAQARPEPRMVPVGPGALPGLVVAEPDPPRHIRPGRAFYDRNDVLNAIGDKIGLVKSWGLRVSRDAPNRAGWCECHSIFREDRDPSAMVSIDTGNYWEAHMDRLPLTLFDLMVQIGRASDFGDAVRQLGSTYIGVREGDRRPKSQPAS
jgi:hypothetical protein